MSENIHQVFIANPITTNEDTDLMYFGQSPYGAGNDAAMTFANFKAQTLGIFTSGTGSNSAERTGAFLTGDGLLSIGLGANAQGSNGIAIGAGSKLNVVDSSAAIGDTSVVNSSNSLAVGSGTTCNGESSVAIGYTATATGGSAIALGYTVTANGMSSIAMGESSSATGSGGCIAIGYQVTNSSASGTAIGNTSTIAGTENIGIGYSVTIGTATDSLAIGSFSGVGNSVTNSLAIGKGASSPIGSSHSIALGDTATSKNTYGIAIGANSTVNNTNSIAIGQTATSSGDNSVAIGYGCGTNGTGSIAFGYQAVTVHAGSFVSCDSNGTPFSDTAANQWSHTFAGGFNFALNSTTLATQIDNTGNSITHKGMADQSYSLQTPLTGFSITVPDNCSALVLNPAGSLAAGTITLSANPIDGQIVTVSSSQNILSLIVNANVGQSILTPPGYIAAGGGFTYIYNLANTTWLLLSNSSSTIGLIDNWTPSLTGSGANPGSISYSFQAGQYTIIGNILYYYARVIVSALTIGGASGQLQIEGLPIAAANNLAYDPIGTALVQNTTIDTNTLDIVSRVTHGTSIINLIEPLNSSGNAVAMAITNISATTDITVTGFYFIP